MEREFEVIGEQPLRLRGEYVNKGVKFLALPEEVEFYLQIGAIVPTSDAPLLPSDPDVVRVRRLAAELSPEGVDSVPAVPSATPGTPVRRV